MSHLTAKAPPFRRPLASNAHEAHLPSPPETDTDFFQQHSAAYGPVPEMDPLPQARRTSILSYRSTPLRDPARERSSANLSKWLVVVVPPGSLIPHLGGPSVRASQGTLMPLLPTLYAQLTAIAREFGFPSAVGLCLYLHINEHGIVLTPRVSDDTWQILWGHLFDARSPTAPTVGQIPVAGRVELDIDHNKARWYNAWVTQRQRAELSNSAAPSVAPSHWRGESKTTILDERQDDQSDLLPPPRPRHVPRQLSLLDKYEGASVASSSHVRERPTFNEPENVLPTIYSAALTASRVPEPDLLSPKRTSPVQEEQELTIPAARSTPPRDLSIRVKSWRASATVAPSPLAATGQISLDPAHMPNNIPLPSPTVPRSGGEEDELRLEDYQWSVSSDGPGDDCEPLYTPELWHHAPSVHLAARAEGSVLLSPSSMATSWGPNAEYEGFSYFAPVSSRASSVNLEDRLEGSVMLSPSVATSWGPEDDGRSYDFEYDAAQFRVDDYTPDIAHRGFEESPATPLTATSWGPQSWPASPAYISRPATPDIAHRGYDDSPATPTTATSWGPSSWPASPMDVSYPVTPDAAHRGFLSAVPTPARGRLSRISVLPSPGGVARLVFPYFSADRVVSRTVWPFHTNKPAKPAPIDISLRQEYPAIELYPAAYPHMEIYPGHVHAFLPAVDVRTRLPPAYPRLSIYEAVYPHFEIYPGNLMPFEQSTELSVKLPSVYPHMVIYEVAYPHFEIYPGNLVPFKPFTTMNVKLTPVYPILRIYEAAYPTFEIYPGHIMSLSDPVVATQPAVNMAVYPQFEIYAGHIQAYHAPAVNKAMYPDFEIYTGHVSSFACAAPQPALARPAKCPISAAASAAAMFDAFAVASQKSTPKAHKRTISAARSAATMAAAFESTAYSMTEAASSVAVMLWKEYPALVIYPAAYPHLEIYPGHLNAFVMPQSKLAIRLTPAYPTLDIYPVAYPHFEIYPGNVMPFAPFVELSVKLAPSYPAIVLYEAVYPHFEIYPGDLIAFESRARLDVKLVPAYPFMRIYETAYPHFEIYPGHVVSASMRPKHVRTISAAASAAAMTDAFARIAQKTATDKPSHRRTPSAATSTAAMADAFARTAEKVAAASPAHSHKRSISAASSAAAMDSAFEAAAKAPALARGSISAAVSAAAMTNAFAAIAQKTNVHAHKRSISAAASAAAMTVAFEHAASKTTYASLEVALRSDYPRLDIYPAAYPHFEIYPGNIVPFKPSVQLSARLAPVYPVLRIYETVYPSFEIYPGYIVKYRPGKTLRRSQPSDACPLPRKPKRTHAQLYADVYPSPPRRTHAQLHEEVFSAPLRSAVASSWASHSRPRLPTPPATADEQPPTPTTPLTPVVKRRSLSEHRLSLGLHSPAPAPVNTVAHKVSPVVRPPPTPVTTAFVQHHRRTESNESTSSVDSVTGLPRRRDPPPNAMRAPTASRRRSAAPTPMPAQVPPPPVPTIEEPPAPPARRLPEVVSKNGLPLNPTTGLRRSVSSSSTTIPPPQRAFGQPLSPVPERPTGLSRSVSLASDHGRKPSSEFVPTASKSTSPLSPPGPRPSRRQSSARDSLVLERARLFDSESTTAGEPTRITMRHLSEFPTPPAPPLPPIPSARPVSKLDRSKYPFA